MTATQLPPGEGTDEAAVYVPPTDELGKATPKRVQRPIADDTPEVDEDAPLSRADAIRLGIAMGFPTIGAAIMAGGVFEGLGARFYAAIAGLLGVALALAAVRIKAASLQYVTIALGLFGIGLVMLIPTGPGDIVNVTSLASNAAATGDVLRPPVAFTPGWQAIVGWLLGIVGFAATWMAVAIKKAPVALLIPLPVAAISGISVPENAQTASGIAVLVLFSLGLGVVSTAGQLGEGDVRPPLAYELRKTAKSLPLLAVITGALFALAQTNVLFPEPRIDPAEEPQKPKVQPISEVEDRVLFSISDPDGGDVTLGGPVRLGALDVYDGTDWRLPPFSASEFREVEGNGVVDEELLNKRGVQADFRINGLGGTVLPSAANTVAVLASGPQLAFDERTGNLRVAAGQVQSGLRYTVAAAGIPAVDDLRAITEPLPPGVEEFAEMPTPPPAVRALLDDANQQFDNQWDKFFFLYSHVIDNVVVTGLGTPKEIPPERAQEILGDTLESSPFEFVALQAMLARWAGVPARIGYGFDPTKGTVIDGAIEIRPRHGISFVEVYFPGFKWLPVVGTPKQAKATVGADAGQQQTDESILPSNDIAVQLFLPVVVPAPSNAAETLRVVTAIVLGLALLILLIYLLTPAVRKARIRSARRAAVRASGPRARIALAYSEWRDYATDYGFTYTSDTPLMFLDRFLPDPEHTQLAWLTTRALWGDLQDVADGRATMTNGLIELGADLESDLEPLSGLDDDAMASAAEELSRSLRRRLSQAQPTTIRFVAAISRLSIRDPYAPGTDLTRPEGETDEQASAEPKAGRFRRRRAAKEFS